MTNTWPFEDSSTMLMAGLAMKLDKSMDDSDEDDNVYFDGFVTIKLPNRLAKDDWGLLLKLVYDTYDSKKDIFIYTHLLAWACAMGWTVFQCDIVA